MYPIKSKEKENYQELEVDDRDSVELLVHQIGMDFTSLYLFNHFNNQHNH